MTRSRAAAPVLLTTIVFALGSFVALAAPMAASAAEPTVVPVSIQPVAFNNSLQVVGRLGQDAALWSNGTNASTGAIVAATAIGDDGSILGYDQSANLVVRRGDALTTIASRNLATGTGVHAGGLRPDGTAVYVSSSGPADDSRHSLVFGGETLWSFRTLAQRDEIAGALDGGTMIRFRISEEQPQLTSHYARPGGPSVDIPPTLYPLGVAPEGKLLTLQIPDGTARMLTIADNGTTSIVDPGLPPGVTGFDDATSGQLNAKGRILIETANGDMAGSDVGYGDFTGLYTWTKASGWIDLTKLAASAADATLLPRAVAVNGWGDMLIRYDRNQDGGGVLPTDTGAILRQPRAALTGVIRNSASSGRSRSGRTAGSVSRQVIRLTGGPTTLTTRTSRNGTFRFQVPEGTGYSITAPAGTCVQVTNGCHTTIPVDVKPGAAPVRLDRTTVASIASFVARRNAVVRRVRGAASFPIRCRAKTACRVRVTVKAGRKVVGTSGARLIVVPRNRTRTVKVVLNKASIPLFIRSSRLPVTATLTVNAGRERTTIVQGFRIAR
jgi:hypothetical protein